VPSLLLDTTVLIDVLRGRPETVDRLRQAVAARETLWTCAVNVEEIVRGLRTRERDAAGALLDGLRIAPLGREQGERAGAWRRAFAERGVTLAQADCLVAAAAAGVGATLATGNPKDFPMDEVSVDVWPPGA
jgi:predicted nucleic acid-binding protein